MAVIAGLISILLGVIGLRLWVGDFFIVAKGLLPVSLLFAGFVALIVGLSSKAAPSSEKKGHEKS